MLTPIRPIQVPAAIEPITSSATAAAGGNGDFQKIFASAIQHVESSTQTADTAVRAYLNGDNQELHSTILATQSADLDFEMFLQVRNKVVSAYEEIMRLQV
jgi:flagellar hook-basal body complex protein FliE